MKKFVKGVSVLAALAMVNPATIVSATTATGQPQSDVTQNTNETATKATPLPTNNVHHISNMFVTAAQYVAFGGMGTLDLHLYSSEETQYLESIYIVIPKGLTVDGGIDAMQKSLDRYIQTKPINPATGPIIHNGTLSIRQLKDTVTTGREVYQIVPSTGAYVVKREYPENSLMTIPIRVAGKDSNLTQILLNAETKDDMEQDILFMGAGDGQNVEYDGSISYYPLIATQKVGITEADDEYVCGIAAYGYEKIVKLFTPHLLRNA